MASPEKNETEDEIGDVDPAVIGAIVAQHCSSVGPSEILQLVLEVLTRTTLGEAD